MFQGWDNYFMLLGTAAASLIGLLFVVVTLTAGFERAKLQRGQSLYLTPTVLHFAIVVSACAMTLVPGLTALRTAALLALAGAAGLANTVWVCIGVRALGKSGDPPHWTDFWLYGAAPFGLYLALGGVCLAFAAGEAFAPHGLAALLLALLLLGIRNAWDLITWIAPGRNPPGAN